MADSHPSPQLTSKLSYTPLQNYWHLVKYGSNVKVKNISIADEVSPGHSKFVLKTLILTAAIINTVLYLSWDTGYSLNMPSTHLAPSTVWLDNTQP